MTLRAALKSVVDFLKYLTRPSDALEDLRLRRQAELLAGMQVLSFPLGLIIVIVESVINPSYLTLFPVLFASFGMGVVHYLLARSKYARIGCWIQVINTYCTVTISPFFSPEQHGAIWFLALPILFAQLLLGEKEAGLFGLLSLVARFLIHGS